MKRNPFKIVACLDVETNNDAIYGESYAILYQLSVLKDFKTSLSDVNVINFNKELDIYIDRDFKIICERLDEIIEKGLMENIVPIVMVHNLAFESIVFANYFNRYETFSLSKSKHNQLIITLNKDGVKLIQFWDTLNFTGKSLSEMGKECGYHKSGSWDYSKIRTPLDELTDEELDYAKRDVIIPFIYMSYWLKINPDVNEGDLGCNILTKTSVVKYKRNNMLLNLKFDNGKRLKDNWITHNQTQKPKTDKELYLIHGANRGGANYCSFNHAGKVFKKDNGYHIYKYDANSMHVFHGVAHAVPYNYKEASVEEIVRAAKCVMALTPEYMIEHYDNPFRYYFYAPVNFKNVRLKEGSIFERDGISSFSASRFHEAKYTEERMYNNEAGILFTETLKSMDMGDSASEDAVYVFNKLFSCSDCRIIMSEQTLWEFIQIYDFDEMVVEDGFITSRVNNHAFVQKLSFNTFYKEKDRFKIVLEKFRKCEPIKESEVPKRTPKHIKGILVKGIINMKDSVEAYYSQLKSELNSLFGIENINEVKNSIKMDKNGFYISDELHGVSSLPKFPQTWYQYGSHIAGWSRIHQLLFMYLLKDDVDAFICGDTDSHKIYTKLTYEEIEERLSYLNYYCKEAVDKSNRRCKELFWFDDMPHLGEYILEGECEEIYSAWNKAYITLENGEIKLTVAGLTTNNKFELTDGTIIDHSLNKIANDLYKRGESFEDICITLLNYNNEISYTVTGHTNKIIPNWGEIDPYYGQPLAITVTPLNKKLGEVFDEINGLNFSYSQNNNNKIKDTGHYIEWPIDSDEFIIVDLF